MGRSRPQGLFAAIGFIPVLFLHPIILLFTLGALLSACLPPEWGANAILHPQRRALTPIMTPVHEDFRFESQGAQLRGWLFRGTPPRRGLIVYLHGVGDNRLSGVGVAARFGPRGYDVVSYDSRAHGESTGGDCTYGFREKRDLSRALDELHADHAILFGSSMGAAVALLAAADDPRVRGVIVQSPFASMRDVIHDMAPFFAFSGQVDSALSLAERKADFRADQVVPEDASRRIRVPVLILHGDHDHKIPLSHARRIYDALPGRRELVVLPGAGHNDVLAREESWTAISRFLATLPPESAETPRP